MELLVNGLGEIGLSSYKKSAPVNCEVEGFRHAGRNERLNEFKYRETSPSFHIYLVLKKKLLIKEESSAPLTVERRVLGMYVEMEDGKAQVPLNEFKNRDISPAFHMIFRF